MLNWKKTFGRSIITVDLWTTSAWWTRNNVSDIVEEIRCTHKSRNFTLETETKSKLAFLDSSGQARKRMYSKACVQEKDVGWSTQIFPVVLLRCRRNLVRCLAIRAQYICSRGTLRDELKAIQTLHENGYQKSLFSEAWSQLNPWSGSPLYFFRVSSKGDAHAEMRSFILPVYSIFPAAKLKCICVPPHRWCLYRSRTICVN